VRESRGLAPPLLSANGRRFAAWTFAGCAAFVAVIGALVAGESAPDSLDRVADQRVQAAFAGHHAAALWIADLAQPVALAVLTGAVVVACLAARQPRGAALAVLGVAIATALTELALKPLVGRTLHGLLVYPSGHSTRAFALAAAAVTVLLGPERHRLPFPARLGAAVAALLAACAVAVAVIVLDYHYATDALAGAATGAGTVAAVALVIDWCWPRLRAAATDRGRGRGGTDSVNGNTKIGKAAAH